jgi:hypothetical protein
VCRQTWRLVAIRALHAWSHHGPFIHGLLPLVLTGTL